MNAASLVFKPDVATGLPRLETNGFPLSESEIHALEAELRKHFERFVHGHGSIVTIETPLRSFPRPARFRLSVRRSDQRCPDLVFEPVDEFGVLRADDGAVGLAGAKRRGAEGSMIGAHSATQPRAPCDWSTAMLEDIERRCSPEAMERLDRAGAHALRFVIDELRAIRAERPDDLAPLMIAAYTSLGERMSRDLDDERIGLYALAARAIDRLFETLLPKNSPHSPERPSDSARRTEASVKLRRAGRFLARLLGISDESML